MEMHKVAPVFFDEHHDANCQQTRLLKYAGMLCDLTDTNTFSGSDLIVAITEDIATHKEMLTSMGVVMDGIFEKTDTQWTDEMKAVIARLVEDKHQCASEAHLASMFLVCEINGETRFKIPPPGD